MWIQQGGNCNSNFQYFSYIYIWANADTDLMYKLGPDVLGVELWGNVIIYVLQI